MNLRTVFIQQLIKWQEKRRKSSLRNAQYVFASKLLTWYHRPPPIQKIFSLFFPSGKFYKRDKVPRSNRDSRVHIPVLSCKFRNTVHDYTTDHTWGYISGVRNSIRIFLTKQIQRRLKCFEIRLRLFLRRFIISLLGTEYRVRRIFSGI